MFSPRRRRAFGFLAMLLAALAGCDAPSATADDETRRLDAPLTARTERGCYALELRAEPRAPSPDAIFSIVTHVRTGSADRVVLTATMPQHDHGMLTEPEHTALGGGRHRTLGMRLHMPGTWQLRVQVEGPDCDDHVVIPIEQPPG